MQWFEKRGQIAVWIIIGVLILAAIIIVLLIRGPRNLPFIPQPPSEGPFNPTEYLATCVRTAVWETTDQMLNHSGFVNPSAKPLPYKMYNNSQVVYLCYQDNFYKPCVFQHPMYLDEVRDELARYAGEAVTGCLEKMKRAAEQRGYEVSYNVPTYEVRLVNDKIFFGLKNVNLNVSGYEQNKQLNDFNVDINSPLYNLIRVAFEITSQEAQYCNFEPVGYHLMNPRYKIKRDLLQESTKIYTIEDTKTGKKMMIATRGCVIPSGF